MVLFKGSCSKNVKLMNKELLWKKIKSYALEEVENINECNPQILLRLLKQTRLLNRS